ncbi:MAG: response regulator [Nitrospinae bacterium]|nr:response regulator [Nitrospinota bacterium]
MLQEMDIMGAKILIVDDNLTNVEVLQETLARTGYTAVLSTTDPCAAVELYNSYAPDIILLDLNMPVMSGFQVMEELKKIITGEDYLPVLILTAQADTTTRLRALKAGARDFITKPFERAEITARIKNALEVRLLQKELKSKNEGLEQTVRERTKELHDSRLEIIRRLGQAAEYRDGDTGLHIIRMSQYCALLAQAAGMSDDKADVLLNASPMHDIGKIGIPDRILLKPERLDDDEWKIMKTHTIIGAALLDNHPSELLVMAREIALTHHEKWDGSGYPNGLKGEEIPLSGRICAIADIFDALTSVRPYKNAWSDQDAIAEIMRSSNTHYDPFLVKKFTGILDQILVIKERYAEKANQAQGSGRGL